MKPSNGSNSAHLSPSSTRTGLITRINFLGTSCSTTPADWIKNTKGAALPSIIGTSGLVNSTYTLSIPKPANADIKCSTVETLTSPSFNAVDKRVSPTLVGLA